MDHLKRAKSDSETKSTSTGVKKEKKKYPSRNNSDNFSKRNIISNFVRRKGSTKKTTTASDETSEGVKTVSDAGPSNPPDPIDGQPVYALMVTESHAEEYNMGHEHRGRAIILNHEFFDKEDSREGTKIDVERLIEVLPKLGFKVEVYTDLEYFAIYELLRSLSRENYLNSDCIAFFILTHGNKRREISAKDMYYSADKLWDFFTADKCPSLAGKPKMFFINACRGKKKDSGIRFFSRGRTEADSSSKQNSYKIPKHADFLIAYSTVDGYLSYRNVANGTWFIQCLCEVLLEYHETKDLMKMLTITARKVALDYRTHSDIVDDCDLTQVPSITSMLIRDIYLKTKQKTIE